MGEVSEVPFCHKSLGAGHGPAWKAWTEYEESTQSSVTALSGQWTVPPQPTRTNGGQTLFFWNGVEPQDNTAVLQPVLQWGVSAGGGGSYWALASWYVSSSHGTIVTPLVAAAPGDVISGVMTSSSNGTWVVEGTNVNSNKVAAFTYKPKDGKYVYAYEVLEAYTVSNCGDYPSTGAENFSNIKVEIDFKPATPKWVARTQAPITCNEHAIVYNATNVAIAFKTQ